MLVWLYVCIYVRSNCTKAHTSGNVKFDYVNRRIRQLTDASVRFFEDSDGCNTARPGPTVRQIGPR